jgi:RNA polymerase sigma factor (sigma-70 family)
VSPWRAVMEEVVRERRPALVGDARLFVPAMQDAEDLVHDAIVRSFGAERSWTNAYTAEAYVRRVIRTTFLDSARKRRTWRSKSHLFVDESCTRSPEQCVVAGLDVHRALATLSARERTCVVLRFFDDLMVPDIARDLDLSVGAVKRYLSDGTAKLRLALGPDSLPDLEPAGPTVLIDRHPGRSKA